MVITDGVHLVASSIKELHKFAASIGLKEEWFQNKKPYHPHYDLLSKSYYKKAIALGATHVPSRDLVDFLKRIYGDRRSKK